MSHILVGLLGVLVGAILGHRFALGRDKRKEYNQLITPIREILIEQLNTLKQGHYQFGLNESHMNCLQASLSESKFKRIKKAYANYDQYRSKSGEHDSFHYFTKNDEYFDKFTVQTEVLLKELRLK